MTDAYLLLLMAAVWAGNMNTADIPGVRLAYGFMAILCAAAGIALPFVSSPS